MPYESDFARVYDIVVHETEEALAGATEMGFVQWAFGRCPRPVRDILDLGCGQGRFLVPLARAGYRVTGLDNSPDMLAACRRRLDQRDLAARLVQADFTTLDVEGNHDALLCLDAAISYVLDADQIVETLARFRRALRPQGMLILDVWNIIGQWPLFGQTESYTFDGKSIRVEWQEAHTYEDFTSIFRTVFSGRFVENGETRHFRHDEIVRAVTVGEMVMYLKAAGFVQAAAYPSYDLSEPNRVHADVLVFVALNP